MIKGNEKNYLHYLTTVDSVQSRETFGFDFYSKLHTVFSNYPYVNATTIYEITEDFDFVHISTIPSTREEEIMFHVAQLSESGLLGGFLSKKKVVDTEIQFNDGSRLLLVPLFTSKGIEALVFLTISGYFTEFKDTEYLKTLSIQADLAALSASNDRLEKKNKLLDDLFDQRLAEKIVEYSKSNIELNAILDSIQVGVLLTDRNTNKIIKSNLTAEKIIGISNDDILGQLATNFLKPLDTKDTTKVFNNLHETTLTDVLNNQIPILRNNYSIQVSASQMIIETFVDISDYQKVQSKSKDSVNISSIVAKKLKAFDENEEINENDTENIDKVILMLQTEKLLNDNRAQFIKMLSLEFRSPLTIIRSFADILLKYPEKVSSEQGNKYYQNIINTVDYLMSMINNFVFLADNNIKSNPDNKLDYDLIDLINGRIIYWAEHEYAGRNIVFETNKNHIFTYINEHLFKIILHSLVSNAVKFSYPNTEIKISLMERGNRVYFSVQDFGVGIPQEEIHKVTDVFYKTSNNDDKDGLGIGLSMVKIAVNLINGKIKIDSKVGIGTTVTCDFPNITLNFDELE